MKKDLKEKIMVVQSIILSNETFSCDLENGFQKLEYISKASVKTNKEIEFPSALEAMIKNEVEVYFVNKKTFNSIRKSEDYGESILQNLESENQKIEKNVKEF